MHFTAMRTVVTGAIALGLAAAVLQSQEAGRPVRGVSDPGVITTGQAITPAGVQSVFEGRVYGITFGATDADVWVLTGRNRASRPEVYHLDWLENRARGRWEVEGTAALQGIVFDPVRKSPLVGITVPARAAGNRPGGAVQLLRIDGEGFVPLAPDLGLHLAGAPALTRQGAGRVIVPLVFDNALAILDADTGRLTGRVKTGGVAPFGAVVATDGRSAWVSNWGGRWPVDGDVTLPTGVTAGADRVVVDERGIASTGTVTRIDLDAQKVTHTINVGLHPNAMVWDQARHRLFVANANSDSISVIDTAAHGIVSTIALEPFGLKLKGIAPTALAVASDGSRLFVALGGLNAVAVVDVASRRIQGLIPTAWYPNHLALNGDGTKLAIATLLGVGSGWRDKPAERAVHSYRGAVNVVAIPDAPQLDSYTTAVAENNRIATARQQLAAGQPVRPPLRCRCRNGPAIRRSSSTLSTSSRKTAPTISSSAISRGATATSRS